MHSIQESCTRTLYILGKQHVHVPYIMYMEIHVLSTLAYENEKKGNPLNRDLDKQAYIACTYMYLTNGQPCFLLVAEPGQLGGDEGSKNLRLHTQSV